MDTNPSADANPPTVVSVIALRPIARDLRRVARFAPHLDTAVREELEHVAGALEVIADRVRLVERVFEGSEA